MGNAIGIDIGYGFTKSCQSGEVLKIFPTAVSAIVPKGTFSEVRYVTANSERFLIGDDAEREGLGLLDTRISGFLLSNPWLAVLGHVLSETTFLPGNTMMVLCIPPGLYSRTYAKEIEEIIKDSTIAVNDSAPFDLKNAFIRVIPQEAGIFFSLLYDDPVLYYKNVAVFDIGHHTLDLTYFSTGKFVESATQSLPIGISLILDGLSKEFYRHHGFAIHQSDAATLLKEGAITILGESYGLAGVEELVNQYVRQLGSVIEKFFEKLPSLPDLAVAGGGGVLALQKYLCLKRKYQLARNPDTANAHGCWYYGHKITSL